MSKHTPGPWQHSVKLSASENHRGFSIWTADGWALADVQPADENGIEGEANARLIAAAPKMYEYIASSASNGCAEAKRLIAEVEGEKA